MTCSAFEYTNYRDALRARISEQKEDQGMSHRELAEKSRVERTYISHVLHERGNFNSDQLYSVARILNFDAEECEYLLLLLEIERTQLPERRELMTKRCDQLRSEHRKLALPSAWQNLTDITHHVFNPAYALVYHFVLTTRITSVDEIVRRLGASPECVTDALREIERRNTVSNAVPAEAVPIVGCGRKQDPGSRYLRWRGAGLPSGHLGFYFTALAGLNPRERGALEDGFLDFIQQHLRTDAACDTQPVQLHFDVIPY